MSQLISNASTTMTLKGITDLLSVEHNKAMKTVFQMTESPDFGSVEKIATQYINCSCSKTKHKPFEDIE